jgi:dihydroneopterin triphosphate diphosphatase
MARSQFQVLIIPYRIANDGTLEYAVTKRSDMEAWQFLSGGGEDHESPIEAARREADEEGGIPRDLEFLQLDSMASIPANNFSAQKEWGEDVYVIPEYSFCVDVGARDLSLSHEHTETRWLPYHEADRLLTWDSNKTALWEVHQRITTLSKRSAPC